MNNYFVEREFCSQFDMTKFCLHFFDWLSNILHLLHCDIYTIYYALVTLIVVVPMILFVLFMQCDILSMGSIFD